MNGDKQLIQTVADNVRAALGADKKSISELAVVIGVNRTTAGKRYNGTVEFRLGDLEAIGKWLGYEPLSFLNQEFKVHPRAHNIAA